MEKLGFEAARVQEFQEALRFTYHPTIDIFLEKKTAFRELGSFLIASTLMPLERPQSLFPQKGWYGALFDALAFEERDPDTRNLSVVSLNYDRSLEHFLAKNIDYNCHDSHVKAAHAKRERITLVHAHGSLGDYPEVPYGTDPSEEAAIRSAAASIKIVSDRLEDSPDFKMAQEVLAGAKHIVFLGFGYHERTLTALLKDVDEENVFFYGTAMGLNQEARKSIIERLRGRIALSGVNDVNQDCLSLLREIGVVQ
jgi:hypothetical protein